MAASFLASGPLGIASVRRLRRPATLGSPTRWPLLFLLFFDRLVGRAAIDPGFGDLVVAEPEHNVRPRNITCFTCWVLTIVNDKVKYILQSTIALRGFKFMAVTNREYHVCPYLFYSDAPAALEFLCKAFGFEERFRHPMPDGRIGYAELTGPGGDVMLSSVFPEGGFASPLDLPALHSIVHCSVDDADAHCERAKAAGATITSEPSDAYGLRMYRATDPEGHRWIFAGPIRKSAKKRKA